MSELVKKHPHFRRVLYLLGWTRSSSVLLGGFFLICGLIVYVWWPLAQEAFALFNWNGPWWLYMDWLLLGIFAWTYYTNQTPPFFAVLAHGMAALAFWRAGLMAKQVWKKSAIPVIRKLQRVA